MIDRLVRGAVRGVWAVALATAVCGSTSPSWAQDAAERPPEAVEVDPIRCWWQSDKGAVRIGETFTLLLTCAVFETDDVQVIPDESRLAASVVQFSPFEVVGGEHPADLRAGTRRFFQYTYVLRLINPDLIGRDVLVPDTTLHYRVNSRVSANAALEGRDHTYLLPAHWMHVQSLVPFEASDIRDSPGNAFGSPEALTYRASVLRIAAMTLVALGALMALVSLIRAFGQLRGRTIANAHPLGASGVKHLAVRELRAVARTVGEAGWSEALVGRAAAATRLAASLAVGRPVAQHRAEAVPSGEGRVLMRIPWRRFSAFAFSGAATTADLDRALATLRDNAPARRRQAIEELRGGLDAFTAAGYRETHELDREALDAALAQAMAGARRVRVPPAWPLSLLPFWKAQPSRTGAPA